MRHKILLGLTTTPKSDWREKVKEIEKFKIEELALFPTFLKIDKRKELYALLEKTKIKNIPHVHLRDDMEEWELDLFYNKYNSKLFNIHPNLAGLNFVENSKYKEIIFVENLFELNDIYIEILNKCAGLCIDFSHWDHHRSISENNGYEKMEELVKKYKIGCCHVSAVKEKEVGEIGCQGKPEILKSNSHMLSNISEMDYIKKYVQYLSEYMSIELENDFKEQLEVKEYLEKIINL